MSSMDLIGDLAVLPPAGITFAGVEALRAAGGDMGAGRVGSAVVTAIVCRVRAVLCVLSVTQELSRTA